MSEFMKQYKARLDEAAKKETEKQELLKTLKKLTISAKATLDCFKHIHNYVETYDSNDLYTAYQFIRCQLDQIKRHISKIEATIDE